MSLACGPSACPGECLLFQGAVLGRYLHHWLGLIVRAILLEEQQMYYFFRDCLIEITYNWWLWCFAWEMLPHTLSPVGGSCLGSGGTLWEEVHLWGRLWEVIASPYFLFVPPPSPSHIMLLKMCSLSFLIWLATVLPPLCGTLGGINSWEVTQTWSVITAAKVTSIMGKKDFALSVAFYHLSTRTVLSPYSRHWFPLPLETNEHELNAIRSFLVIPATHNVLSSHMHKWLPYQVAQIDNTVESSSECWWLEGHAKTLIYQSCRNLWPAIPER